MILIVILIYLLFCVLTKIDHYKAFILDKDQFSINWVDIGIIKIK
jgi:hypothetical protein